MEYELIQQENNQKFVAIIRWIDFTNVFTGFLFDGLLWLFFELLSFLWLCLLNNDANNSSFCFVVCLPILVFLLFYMF